MKAIDKLIEEFLEYLQIERNVSPLTIRNYRHYLMRFNNWFDSSTSNKQASQINQQVIRRYRVYLARYSDKRGMTLQKVTQNYHLIALRAFLRFLQRQDVKTISAEKVELAKAESKSLKFLNKNQLHRLFNQPDLTTAQGMRDRSMLELLFSTGMRISELVSLNRNKIDLKSREIGIIGKGGKARVVFISDSAAHWLGEYLRHRTDKHKPLFVRYSGKKASPGQGEEALRLSARSVQRAVEKYVKSARLPVKITPHGIRHSFATDLLTSGADLRAIQEMLGHKNVSTTQIYTHVTNPQLKKIHEKFHKKG